MTRPDLESLGARARQAGASFYANPVFFDSKEYGDDLERWAADGLAWGNGWLREDACRTESIPARLYQPIW